MLFAVHVRMALCLQPEYLCLFEHVSTLPHRRCQKVSGEGNGNASQLAATMAASAAQAAPLERGQVS